MGAVLAETTGATDAWAGIINSLTGQFSVEQIVPVVTTALAAAVVLAFFWWGVRKVLRIIMSAFRKGRVSV